LRRRFRPTAPLAAPGFGPARDHTSVETAARLELDAELKLAAATASMALYEATQRYKSPNDYLTALYMLLSEAAQRDMRSLRSSANADATSLEVARGCWQRAAADMTAHFQKLYEARAYAALTESSEIDDAAFAAAHTVRTVAGMRLWSPAVIMRRFDRRSQLDARLASLEQQTHAVALAQAFLIRSRRPPRLV
jgi:hypothetical protein